MPAKTLLPENIHPLTDFLRNHKRHLQRLKRNRRPAVLTLNGKAEVVVQDAASYQALLEEFEAMEARTGIAEGIASMHRGEGQTADKVFLRLRQKHGLKTK
ncbi:MAG: type II toxin-antitoxin system Phd/YefM family antitoxin [Opitutaceae bacterium]|nr:type II toxin-antitoxin system Phd/YefM family antitoxin [Opitutaceae bacterium]